MMLKKTTLNTNSKAFKVKEITLNKRERVVHLLSDRSDSLEQKSYSNKTKTYISMTDSKLNHSLARQFPTNSNSSSVSVATKCSSQSRSDVEYLSDSSDYSSSNLESKNSANSNGNTLFEDVVYQYYNNFDQK